jgi:hypothetical protein
MKVICKTNNSKLIKDQVYETSVIRNKSKYRGILYIDNLGWYSVNSFTDTSGNPIPKIDIINKNILKREKLDFNSFEEGDILVCVTNRMKILSYNCMYQVEEKSSKKKEYTDRNGFKKEKVENYVKFKGINRKFIINNWCYNFRILNQAEKRELVTSKLLNEKTNVLHKQIRKIDTVVNKNEELLKQIAKSLLDEKRHNLSIIQWAIEKTGKLYSLKEEDFKDLLELPLKEILNKIEN